jgi:hypothetical protein
MTYRMAPLILGAAAFSPPYLAEQSQSCADRDGDRVARRECVFQRLVKPTLEFIPGVGKLA